jgi:hypothetical protein
VSVPVTPNSGTVVRNTVDSTFIELQPCSYSQVLLRFTDPDPGQTLNVTYTGAGTINSDVLEGGDIGSYSLTGNGTASPVARFQFQPSPAYAGRTLLMPFKITDNSCPTLGLQTRVVVVKIAAPRRNLVAVLRASTSSPVNDATICAGSSLTFAWHGAAAGLGAEWPAELPLCLDGQRHRGQQQHPRRDGSSAGHYPATG